MNKTASAGLRVGVTVLLVATLGYAAFKFIGKGIRTQAGYPVYALFRDATGLAQRSRVQVAGLIIGEITERSLEGGMARVEIKIRDDVALWSNATIFKRSASLLGEFYLDIDPGTPTSIDPLTGEPRANTLLEDCLGKGGEPGCNRIRNVVEAVTMTDVLVQINDTLPVLRDILRDVQQITSGPMQDIVREAEKGVRQNSQAAERLLKHIDEIAVDLRDLERGPVIDDLRASMKNVREITDSVKSLIGHGDDQVSSVGDKVKGNLDKIGTALDKLDRSLDNVEKVTDKVARGEGTIGHLVHDSSLARNASDVLEDTASFIRPITRLQTIIGIREEFNVLARTFKTYLTLRLQPRPDKYYLIELVDDPRGSRDFEHTLTATSGADNSNPTIVNVDTWKRSRAFRISFMFAKRAEFLRHFGATGRVGIKESTGGLGLDLDTWKQRFVLQLDLFDFAANDLPRLKIAATLELFKHVWLLGGVDDVMNPSLDDAFPPAATCGPSTPRSWCITGRDYFVGAMLTFNDDDLRSLLAIGGSALGGIAR